MRQVQASEAKTRFLQLLDEVEKGDSFLITRHGKPVARITPEADRRQAEIEQALADLRALPSRRHRLTVVEILSARDEGRKP
ncbi:MAG TPA: type II toxin-antitoxin system prevent-host-death family antitoxin [Acidobacteriaceae bacterium]|jgi:prevent-host-death family protein|nr:type II toxin-antitoxin system prevent-host-death family antitoxin [Acidobacteriaceae bacterium]